MRLRELAAACSLVLTSCYLEEESTDTTPPTIKEPSAGEVFDRCTVRARINGPGPNGSGGIGAHASWRVNGAGGDEVLTNVTDWRTPENFLFAVTLVPGANHLELGRCDEFDFCGWTPVDVSVALHAGSPDCAFAGSGQLLFEGTGDELVGLAILSDGRPIYGTWLPAGGASLAGAVYARRTDGKPDMTFGVDGVVTTPRSGLVRPIALANGGFMITHLGGGGADVSYVSRYDANGVLDTSYGVAGVVELRDPQTSALLGIMDARPSADGSVVIASSNYIARLDATGAFTTFTSFDAGTVTATASAAAIDANGTVALVAGNLVVKASLGTGIDTAFGNGGTLTLPVVPMTLNAVTWHAGSIAIAQSLETDGVRLTLVSATGVVSEVPLAFDSRAQPSSYLRPVQIASAADGSLYVSSTMKHPALSYMDSIVETPEDGSDVGVVRIRNGAVDTTFGTAGYAKTGFMLSWYPISYETVEDVPTSLTIGPDGAPWFIGRSATTPLASVDPNYRRGPGVVVGKLVP